MVLSRHSRRRIPPGQRLVSEFRKGTTHKRKKPEGVGRPKKKKKKNYNNNNKLTASKRTRKGDIF